MEQAEETQAKRNRQGSQPVLPARQSKVPFDPLLLTYFQRLLLCCVWRCGWRQFRCWEIFTLCVAHRAQPPPQACGRHHGRALPEVRWDATADSSERPQCVPSTETQTPRSWGSQRLPAWSRSHCGPKCSHGDLVSGSTLRRAPDMHVRTCVRVPAAPLYCSPTTRFSGTGSLTEPWLS